MTDLILMVMGGAVLGLWLLGLFVWGLAASVRNLFARTQPAGPAPTMRLTRRRARPSVRPRLFDQDENGRYRIAG
ncbi:MAG: hypothetical protein ACRDJ2_15595 [Actinomycetota bacterium]